MEEADYRGRVDHDEPSLVGVATSLLEPEFLVERFGCCEIFDGKAD